MLNVAILIYDRMELLDMSGIQTALSTANEFSDNSYHLMTVGFHNTVITCESGIRLVADKTIDELEYCHTLIIPGGIGARCASLSCDEKQLLQAAVKKSRRIVTICTGIFMLARLGLCEGMTVATHWAYSQQLQCEYPNLIVDKDKLFVRDTLRLSEHNTTSKTIWSSAGVTSGIDLALRLIELDINRTIAIKVAQYLVVYLKRSGSQQQFSGLLQLQSPKSDVIGNLLNWMKERLDKPLSVQQMADEANLSERQFRRLFVRETGKTPASYLEELRMDAAKNLLVNTDQSIKKLAMSLGFNTADGFRRAFERKFHLPPSQYREQWRQSG